MVKGAVAVAFGVATCANHPDREALGICVRCRTRVCAECSTKVDGINYCVSCLASLAAEKGERTQSDETSPAWFAWLAAIALFGVLALSAWGVVELSLP